MSEMIERVARAICAAQGYNPIEIGDHDLKAARAAIAAMREPTREMAHFGHGHWTDGKGAISIWQAMIDTALE